MRRVRSLRALLLTVVLAGSSMAILTQAPDALASPTADSSSASDKVGGEERAVVLLNLRGTIDGKPVTKVGSPVSNNVFAVYLASLDELSAPKQVKPTRLEKSAEAGGWHAWLLRPGMYYLLILPPGVAQNPPAVAYHTPGGRFGRLTRYEFAPGRGAFWSPELMMYVFDGPAPADFEPLPGFSFEVSSAERIVYLGSLSTTCKAGRGLFGGLIDSCGDFELADEVTGAQQLALQAFPGLTVEVRHVMRYGEPTSGLRPDDLAAMSVVGDAPAGVASDIGGTALRPWGTVHGVGQGFMVYNLLAATFEMTKSAKDRQKAEETAARLAPCMQRLGASLDQGRYRASLLQSLGQAAAARGITVRPPDTSESPAAEPALQLSARTPIMRLAASGGPETLALDLVVDLRLYDETDRTLRYSSLLSFGPELQSRTPFVERSPLYLRPVAARPPARAITEWCGEGGPALLAEDIEAGLRSIAAQFMDDIDR